MNTKENESGSVTIEACVVLMLFMFLILTLYSFFMIFGAQGKIRSTMLQSAESLSLDPYLSSSVPESVWRTDGVQKLLLKLITDATTSNDGFVNTTKWDEIDPSTGDQSKVVAAAKERFLAYFAGGDETVADTILRSYRIVDGFSGLHFDQTNVDSDGNVNLVITYEQKYFFDYPLFGLSNVKRKEVVVSHLWK